MTFTGKCRLRCLYGAVRMLGFAVASHHPGLPVFSPATHCALSLEALPGARPLAVALRQLRAAARAAMRSHGVRRRECGTGRGRGRAPFHGRCGERPFCARGAAGRAGAISRS